MYPVTLYLSDIICKFETCKRFSENKRINISTVTFIDGGRTEGNFERVAFSRPTTVYGVMRYRAEGFTYSRESLHSTCADFAQCEVPTLRL